MISDEYKQQIVSYRTSHDGWGGSAIKYNGDFTVRYLNKTKHIHSVLDFGCGEGVLGPFVRERVERELDWVEYDPSIAGKDVLPIGTFDIILSNDVMEHVEPEMVDETFRWMGDHSKAQMHSIACSLTGTYLPDGRDVHICVQPPAWWGDKLNAASNQRCMFRRDEMVQRRSEWKRRCTFIYERC